MKSRKEFRQRHRIGIILLMTPSRVNNWVKPVARSGFKRACPFSFSTVSIKMLQSLCFRKKVETLRKLDVRWKNISPVPFLKDSCQIVTAHMPTQEVLLSFTKCNIRPLFNDVGAAHWAWVPEKQSWYGTANSWNFMIEQLRPSQSISAPKATAQSLNK